MIVRAGLIGYGYAGRIFHAPLIAATDGLTLAAVATAQDAAVRAAWPGVETLPDPADLFARRDIDLIVIATPNDTHAPLARAALEAGKHVVVDKPFTLDMAQARDLSIVAEQCGRVLSVFHNRRWDSDFLGVRTAIAQGQIGEVVHFESHFDRFRPQVRDRWRERAGPGAGVWFDLGPHLADQALVLFGLPDGVSADLAVLREGAGADDWAHVVLRYPRLRVILHAGMLAAGGAARFAVHGDKGSLVKRMPDRQEAQLLAGMTPGAVGWGADPDAIVVFDGAGGERFLPSPAGDQRAYYAAVASAVRDGGRNPASPVEALAVMAVIEAGIASARDGCVKRLDLSEAELRRFHAARSL